MSVTTPVGFLASGVAAGLRKSGKPDVALVYNEGPLHVAAAVFTSNRVIAAPILWTRQTAADGRLDAVIINSGGANACTGLDGFDDSQTTAERVVEALKKSGREVAETDVAVCSTGLIGVRLDMKRLLKGVDDAVHALSQAGGSDAAKAIMTTDKVPKCVAVRREPWSIGGIAKGAGMLAPGLATMIVILTTDAVLDERRAKGALEEAVRGTFNRIDSDGCMSTNDIVLLMASGASGVTPDPDEFEDALDAACASLARALVADAEGASHDIAITVQGATTEEAAEAVARAISRSSLFKAAIFGNDPNWGRILAAAGTVPVDVAPFDPLLLDVWINGVQVCRAQAAHEDRSLVDLKPREVSVVVDLHAGEASATLWTNDLTHDYVEENSAYST
ncbi:MAG: bifunctional glutamate N-acetyltransferase/amino-acid acetyltransferase ArgJ [Demequinaceae bacterium]|nr:bifunctional glutamate N-acetyltransferase/amino-acid acetyltransferase ArgJ [Demequinaceae bacterium]